MEWLGLRLLVDVRLLKEGGWREMDWLEFRSILANGPTFEERCWPALAWLLLRLLTDLRPFTGRRCWLVRGWLVLKLLANVWSSTKDWRELGMLPNVLPFETRCERVGGTSGKSASVVLLLLLLWL
jgi:hypothetical protein